MKKFLCVLCAFFISAMPNAMAAKQDSTQVIERSESIEFVYVYFTALSGNFHQLIIPGSQFKSALENGLKFDGSSIPGCTNIFNSDMHLALDPSSFFIHAKKEGEYQTARIFAYIYQDEDVPYPADPRYLLEQSIASAAELNSEFYMGVEMEFFLLEKNSQGEMTPWDSGYYFGAETDAKKDVIHLEIMQTLLENGVIIEKLHHEVAPGQLEFSIRYSTPIEIADQVMLSKHLVCQIAKRHGLIATFMPKPLVGMNGSGMHIHLSVSDKATKENLFFDADRDSFLSPLAQNCISGILNRVSDGAILLNSSVNSFKRLIPGYEAPVYVCWANKNRSALVRIPQINADQPYATRIEIRSPDALCNPYLAFNFLLQSSLAGIINEEPAIPPTEENLFQLTLAEIEDRGIKTLPTSLDQAVKKFSQSSSMQGVFNEILIREFVKLKSKEVDESQKSVSSWELQTYL